MGADSVEEGMLKIRELLQGRRKETPSNEPDDRQPYLIVGLGNPGREYRDTRHNIGFMVIDRLAETENISLSRVQNKAILGSGTVAGARVILAKPQTYMNLSGDAIAPLVRFYKVPQANFLLIHDDLDLPFGTIRLRPGGGPGGQKGVASTINKLGTRDFARMRLGIGRPPGRMDPAAYVLQEFHQQDKEILDQVIEQAVKAARVFIQDGLDAAMNQFNGPVNA